MNGPKRSSRRNHPWTHDQGLGSAVAVALLALLGGLAHATGDDEVYTWKDATGRVHYGNRPPEGQIAEPVQLNARPVTVQPTRQIYTWTDAKGRTHYGARPPPDIPAKELKEEDSSLSTIRSARIREGERRLLHEQGAQGK
ncbi:MAG: DUF4124 domain-containing protein [Candidatus Contendobacter sp.]|nr:DUF4124 domain-containing protein [Candidatus Contendobacter sp.]